MRNVAKRFACVLMLSLARLALIPADSLAQGPSPLMPPQSHAFG